MKSIYLRIILFIFLALFIFLVGSYFYLDKWLGNELEEILNDDPNRSTNISFEDFKLSFVQGDLSLNNVEIIPVSVDSTESILVTVDRFNIEGVSLYKLFFNREIRTETLLIINPKATLKLSSKQAVVGNSTEINKLWEDILTRVTVSDLLVENGQITIVDEKTSQEQLKMEAIDLMVTQIEIDTSTIDDPFPFKYKDIALSAEQIDVNLKEFSIAIPELTATEKTVRIKKIDVLPKSINSNGQTLTIRTDVLDISHFDWGFDNEEFFLRIKTFEINQAGLSVKKEKLISNTGDEKTLLATSLSALPITLHIDSITIKDSHIAYQKINDETNETGTIAFNNVYATAYNITNDSSELTHNKWAMIDIKSRFMNSSSLDAHFEFDLKSTTDAFTGNGKLGKTNLEDLNDMLIPLAGVEASGQLNHFEFIINGNKYNASGSLEMEYDKIKVAVLNSKKDKKNILFSSLADIVINNNNDKESRSYKIGKIAASKVRHKSFIHYLWAALKSGITDIVAPKISHKKNKKRNK